MVQAMPFVRATASFARSAICAPRLRRGAFLWLVLAITLVGWSLTQDWQRTLSLAAAESAAAAASTLLDEAP